MHAYEVGKLYTDRRLWPELAQYNYRAGEHELVLFYRSPTASEIHDISKGRAEFALYTRSTQIVFLFRFGKEGLWSDAPYSIHLVPPEQRVLPPETGPEEAALLHIVLVDASTGIIRALRVISMPSIFTQALHAAIQAQSGMSFTCSAYNGELESLLASYSSSDLAERAQIRFTSYPTR